MNYANSRNDGFNNQDNNIKKPVSSLYQKEKHRKAFKKSTIHYADSETMQMYDSEKFDASPGTINHQYHHSMADVGSNKSNDSQNFFYHKYESPKHKKRHNEKYSKRKESVSSNSSASNNQMMIKSRIPIPNAVKNLSKNGVTASAKTEKKHFSKIRAPYNGQINDKDTLEYNSIEYQSQLHGARSRQDLRILDLEPTSMDASTEEYTEDLQNNLVVNLEDLVNEEYYINHISEAIHSKSQLTKFVRKWWSVTEMSTVKDMQAFFEESSSKKLMKTHQITLTLFMSYLEVYEHHVYENSRNWSNVKNIINNLHRNFMVFVEFITKNLTEEQYDAAVDWANKLQKVLCTRPVMKSHYNAYNSDLLENNNNMSISLLKDLLRKKAEETEYRKEAIFVLKNMQLVETPMVRDLMLRSITVTKNFQNEQLNGSSFAVNPMNTQSQMHESLQDNQYFSQRDMPDLKSVHYADTKASHKKQFNKTTVFEDELAPKKTKSGPYQKREPELTGEDKFAHLKIPEKKNQKPKTKMLKPSIRTPRNPLKKQSARQFDTLSKLEEADSKDTYSCDSESPLPVIPTPVSPDLKRFPKNQEKPVQRISKKENLLLKKSLKPKNNNSKRAMMKTPTHRLETSIDNFIKTEGNEFINNLMSETRCKKVLQDSQGSINIPNTDRSKGSPSKKNSCMTNLYSPSGDPVFKKKYQIKRDNEANKTTLNSYKSCEKGLGFETSRQKDEKLFKESSFKKYNSVHKKGQYQTRQPTASVDDKANFFDKTPKVEDTPAPNSSTVKESTRSSERSKFAYYKGKKADNDKPFKYTSHEDDVQEDNANIEMVSNRHDYKVKPNFQPECEKRKTQKNQVIDMSLLKIPQNEPGVNDDDNIDLTLNEETIEMLDSVDSPNKRNKFDVLDDFMTPKVTESRKRAQSEEYPFIQNQDVPEQVKEDESVNSLVDYQQTCSPKNMKKSMRAKTDRKGERKDFDSESQCSESKLSNLKLLKLFSESKSQLPPGHNPNVAHKQDSLLAEKLQRMNENDKNAHDISPKSGNDEPCSPQFLVSDTPEESAEELARIDAELARLEEDEDSLDESTTFVRYFLILNRST